MNRPLLVWVPVTLVLWCSGASAQLATVTPPGSSASQPESEGIAKTIVVPLLVAEEDGKPDPADLLTPLSPPFGRGEAGGSPRVEGRVRGNGWILVPPEEFWRLLAIARQRPAGHGAVPDAPLLRAEYTAWLEGYAPHDMPSAPLATIAGQGQVR